LPSGGLLAVSSVTSSIAAAIERAQASGVLDHILVTREDGLPIAHNLSDVKQARRLAAMAAAIVGTGELAAKDLGCGTLRGASMDAEAGLLVCMRAGPQAIVAGLASPDANVGLLLLVIRKLTESVDTAIGDS